MKVTNLTKKDFTPIEFSIKIESKRELEFWWAITNSSYDNLKTHVNGNLMNMDIKPFKNNEIALMSFPDNIFRLIDDTLEPKTN